jgi:hypothetical protein
VDPVGVDLPVVVSESLRIERPPFPEGLDEMVALDVVADLEEDLALVFRDDDLDQGQPVFVLRFELRRQLLDLFGRACGGRGRASSSSRRRPRSSSLSSCRKALPP